MSEMVERVARALYEHDAALASVIWESWPGPRARLTLRRKADKYRKRARAAIAAMREPTEAMLDNGRSAHLASSNAFRELERPVWQAMIDEAL